MQGKIDQILETLHRMELVQKDMQNDIEINTQDLTEHIKRTEILEKKLSKIYQAALVSVGAAVMKFGPDIVRLLGL